MSGGFASRHSERCRTAHGAAPGPVFHRRRHDLSGSAGQRDRRGNSNQRTDGRCQLRTAVCADGRWGAPRIRVSIADFFGAWSAWYSWVETEKTHMKHWRRLSYSRAV